MMEKVTIEFNIYDSVDAERDMHIMLNAKELCDFIVEFANKFNDMDHQISQRDLSDEEKEPFYDIVEQLREAYFATRSPGVKKALSCYD
jgi:hypothetical protein